MGRTIELSREVAAVRAAIDERDDASAREFLIEHCGLDDPGADQAVAYVRAGKAILGVVPTDRTIVAERFFDEGGGMQLILHTPFGARINRAWGLALRKRFCRSFNLELQAAATDNGIVLSLTDQHAFPLEIVFEYVKSASVEYVLTQALLPAPMFAARWRWNAIRALAILRMRGGRKVPPQLLRMRADDLIAAVFPDQAACPENLTGPIRIPDHVLVRETIDNCLHEAMDLDGLLGVLRSLEAGEIRTVAVDTPEPSPFCHEILNANPYAYLDDAPLEERRARAVQLRRTIRGDVDGAGILSAEAIAEVAEESWPVVRDADELHDALATLVALPPVAAWAAWYEELVTATPRNDARLAGRHVLDSAPSDWRSRKRRIPMRRSIRTSTRSRTTPSRKSVRLPSRKFCAAGSSQPGPSRVSNCRSASASIFQRSIAALIRLETQGQLLRGRFRAGETEEWCNRRVLARIHRRTLGTLRREIEPVSSLEYVRFLHRWQHVATGTRLHGIDGTLQVIRQLEGYEIPAAAWEAQILPSRITGYRREYLDQLCYSGEVMWGRLCAHPALARTEEPNRRIRPTKLAPISLFSRENAEALIVRNDEGTSGLSSRGVRRAR